MEKEMKKREPVDYTARGIIIFSPIVLVILAVLIYIGCKYCDMPIKSVVIMFIPCILVFSVILVGIGVLWYKGFKEPLQCSEEKLGKKQVETDVMYIGLLVLGTAFFTFLGLIIYYACRGYLAKDVIKVLQDLSPVDFVTFGIAGVTIFVIFLSTGALVFLGIIKYKKMNTITVEEPENAGLQIHNYFNLIRKYRCPRRHPTLVSKK
jgi:small-conductance mechanosensitive channel